MTILHPTTQRRLQKIPHIPSVWEGDRRPLVGIGSNLELDSEEQGECIIWVDGSEGLVRAMDVVSTEMGPEAIVRTLIRAIENPHNPAQPARPQKIVVRDREIQFFLRGALQNLDITVDYVPDLPIIDELFRGFAEMENAKIPLLPPEYEKPLKQVATAIWEEAPWEAMADHDIVAIEINQVELETVYACVMGMLGQEYGIILYRSLDSLKRFRSSILEEESMEQLEKTFLAQDCWFLNYEAAKSSVLMMEDEDFDLADLPASEIRPLFGSIHPYEGMRPRLDEEEARLVYVMLQSFYKFFQGYHKQLGQDIVPKISRNYQIPINFITDASETISVQISTLPELAVELVEMLEENESDKDEDDEAALPIRDDLVPDESFLSLGMIPWDLAEKLAENPKTYHQSAEVKPVGEGLPVILIQTSRPKAKVMIETIQESGGLDGICFNPGEDPFTDTSYDLGLARTGDGTLFMIAEFRNDDPTHVEARKKWDQRCKKTKGHCGLIIAMGLKGSSRGNPKLHDMMAFFEVKALDTEDLAMGVLQLMPHFDFE